MRWLFVAALSGATLLAACGGEGPQTAISTVTQTGGTTAAATTSVPPLPAGSLTITLPPPPPPPPAPGAGSNVPQPAPGLISTAPVPPSTSTADAAIEAVYDRYLYVLSGLDDYLNSSWLSALTAVTTQRLAEATATQARVIEQSGSHGVGQLRNSRIIIKSTGPNAVSIADCEDYVHFYLASSKTGAPDPGLTRGYYVGTAQLLRLGGRWYVDVFSTTRVTCNF